GTAGFVEFYDFNHGLCSCWFSDKYASRRAAVIALTGSRVGAPLKGCGRRLHHRLILFTGAAAHAHRTDDCVVPDQRQTAGEGHHTTVVGNLDTVKLPAGLSVIR